MLKRNIWLMYAISFLQGMVFYGPVATLYREACGVSILQIAVIESISLALCLMLELPWGVVADKIGYKRTLLLCNGLYFVSKIVFWKADGFGLFLLERIMLSVVISGLSGVDMSVLYLSCGEEDSQKVFGTYESLGTAGLLAASFIYTAAVGEDYRLAGFLTMLSYGAAAIFSLFLIEVKEEKERSSIGEFLEVFRIRKKTPGILLFLLAAALLGESHQMITVFLSQLKYETLGISHEGMGLIYIILTVIGLGGVWSSKIRDKIGIKKSAVLCFAGGFLSCFILAVTDHRILAVASLMVFRAAFTIWSPLQMELQNRMVITKQRATELSVNALFIDSVAVVINVIFGRLADSNLSGSFCFGGILCLTGTVFFFLWIKNKKLYDNVEKSDVE